MNLQVQPGNPGFMDLTWEQPKIVGGIPIRNYRILIQDPQNQYQQMTIETQDASTLYKLKTSPNMQGRFFSATI